MLAGIDQLNLAEESSTLLRNDIERLLTDGYLDMVGDYEEKALRPKLTENRARVLEAAGERSIALDRFEGTRTNREQISATPLARAPA